MHTRRCIILIIGLLLETSSMAQRGENASLAVSKGPNGTITATFRWGKTDIITGDNNFSHYVADGMSIVNVDPGKPALPTLSTLITLPRGSALTLTSVSGKEEPLPDTLPYGWPLAPQTAAQPKDSAWPGYHPDTKAYSTDEWYRGGEPVEIQHIGTMGSNEVYRLTIRPLAYNPLQRIMKAYGSLDISLAAEKPSAAEDAHAALPQRYIVVSRPQFRQGLQPFIQWKRQEGYIVEEVYADTNKRNVVKALIENRWEDPDGRWPQYILLVGDVSQLQSYVGTTRPQGLNNHATDLYYAEHTGDYLPDALLGRWPVNDTAELRAVVEKTLRYEQCHNLDTLQLRRAILVAGQESSSPAPTTTNGQVNYAKGRLLAEHPDMDTSCYYNPASGDQRPDILHDIAQGASFLNYTAHCTTGGWSKPSVGFTSIDTLGCTQPMLYINNCCLSNAFDGTCFGERLLRTAQGGAIGAIGATNSTLWEEDYFWSVGPKFPVSLTPAYDSLHQGAVDMWFADDATTQGALLAAGNLAVTAFGSPYDKFYWETYCLLGDPSLRPYIGVPNDIWLWTPDSINVGATSVRISGPEGATVSAVQGDRLLVAMELGDQRSTLLDFCQSADTLPIIVTATKAQGIPVVDTIHTVLPRGAAVAFLNATATDTIIDFTLANIGTDTVFNLTIHISCIDTSLATFTAPQITVDTLIPGEQTTLHAGISIDKWYLRWSGLLEASAPGGTLECQPLRIGARLNTPAPSLTFRLLDTDTAEAAAIEPATDYLIQCVVNGMCDSVALAVTAIPGELLLTDTSATTTTLTAISTPDTVTHLHIEAFVLRGNYSRSYDLWLTAGERHDSFEEGLSSYPWDISSMRPWIVDTTTSHTGTASLRSASIGSHMTSDIALDLCVDNPDSIAFWARTSSEYNYDKLIFSVDGVKQMDLSGNAGWRRCVYPLAVGNHRLLWRYTKDESGNDGSDCAWIDDVELPRALWDSAYGWFGQSNPLTIESTDDATAPLTIAPTVTTDIAWITSTSALTATLYDMLGRQLATMHLDAGIPQSISLRQLHDGIYIIRTDNGASHKIIKH